MPPISTEPLWEYLLKETQNHRKAMEESTSSNQSPGGIRVPLEVGGSIWSAEVEELANERIRLIVDREALHRMREHQEGSIHFQPDNSAMQQAPGKISSDGFLESDRVRLNFELK